MNSPTHYPPTLDHQRRRLEALVHPPAAPVQTPTPWVQALLNFADTIISCLTSERELRIWQRPRHGRQVWFAYDPVTDQKRQFFSENEVRYWLDSRYYE